MRALELVDHLYSRFVDSIDVPSREHARSLPHTLRLAPSPSARWSEVFTHEVTLAAPLLFAQGMSNVASEQVEDAVQAHALAVIGAFGKDRILDGQVEPTTELVSVLAAVRAERERAMDRLAGPTRDYELADERALSAMKVERLLLVRARPMDLAMYQTISIAKQTPGFPASLALAHRAGWPEEACKDVHRTLEDIALGLQMHDDVVDWEKDAAAGGAWVVSLARAAPGWKGGRDETTLRQAVLDSGVAARLLVAASQRFACASVRADRLGATRLSGWCLDRASKLTALAEAEVRSAGYAVRAHMLTQWALS